MKKFSFALAIAAVASFALAATASADVSRYQTQSGTLTVKINEYPLVHTFNVDEVNPCDGTFTASSGTRDVGGVVEAVTGTLKGGKVAFDAIYTGSNYESEIGYKWGTQSAGALGTSIPAWDSMGTPFSVTVTANLNSSDYKNHGQYVKAMGGGDDAAHSCIGMPLNSSK